MKSQSLRSQIAAIAGTFPDAITAHKDGTVSVKRSYFYRHGMTSEAWEQQVLKYEKNGVKIADFCEAVDRGDHWASWPKLSYFHVTLRAK